MKVASDSSTKLCFAGADALRGHWALAGLVGLAFALAFAVAATTLLDVQPTGAVLATATVVALSEAALALKPTLARGANIAAAIAVVIAAVMRPGQLFDGLPLLCNRAFELSAANQAYVYELFEVGLDATAAASALMVALCFVVAIFVAASCFALQHGHAFGAVVSAVLLFATQAYLGVSAAPLANIAVAATCLAALTLGGARKERLVGDRQVPRRILATLAALVCTAAVAAACWAVYPADLHDDNPAVHAANEQVRDLVAGGEIVADTLAGALAGDDARTGAAAGDESQGANSQESSEVAEQVQSASLSRISSLEWWELLGIILLLCILIASAVFAVKRALVRRSFRSSDADVSFNAQFRHMMRVLGLAGALKENECFSASAADVESRFGAEAAQDYAQAVKVWQHVAYSSYEACADDAASMGAWMRDVKARTLDGLGVPQRVKVLLLCYNRN